MVFKVFRQHRNSSCSLSIVDDIAVVLREACPGHVGVVAGDASDASALEHGSGAGSGGGEVVEAEPFALAVFAAAVGEDHHGVGGRRFEVFEGVGDGSAVDCGIIIIFIDINTFGYSDEVVHVAVDAELPSGLGTGFSPGQLHLVGARSTHSGVGGCRAGDSGVDVDGVAPLAGAFVAAVGTDLQGVVLVGGEASESVGNMPFGIVCRSCYGNKILLVAVEAYLPISVGPVLVPSQCHLASLGITHLCKRSWSVTCHVGGEADSFAPAAHFFFANALYLSKVASFGIQIGDGIVGVDSVFSSPVVVGDSDVNIVDIEIICIMINIFDSNTFGTGRECVLIRQPGRCISYADFVAIREHIRSVSVVTNFESLNITIRVSSVVETEVYTILCATEHWGYQRCSVF